MADARIGLDRAHRTYVHASGAYRYRWVPRYEALAWHGAPMFDVVRAACEHRVGSCAMATRCSLAPCACAPDPAARVLMDATSQVLDAGG